MIAENIPVKPPKQGDTSPNQAGPSFLTARSLVTPVAPEIWMGQWQPDEETSETGVKVAASS